MIEEKESKTRESMRMMGMKDSAYYVSWMIFHFIHATYVSLIMGIMSIFLLKNTNFILIFLYYLIYSYSIFGIILIFAALFNTVKTATPTFIVLFLISYYARYALVNSTSDLVRILVSLVPNLALYNGGLVVWA